MDGEQQPAHTIVASDITADDDLSEQDDDEYGGGLLEDPFSPRSDDDADAADADAADGADADGDGDGNDDGDSSQSTTRPQTAAAEQADAILPLVSKSKLLVARSAFPLMLNAALSASPAPATSV